MLCDYSNIIITQYGKSIIAICRKRVLHNLSIGSTLPNTKNFFSVITLGVLCYNMGHKKVDCPLCGLRYRQTPVNTQTSNPPYGLFLCFVYVC